MLYCLFCILEGKHAPGRYASDAVARGPQANEAITVQYGAAVCADHVDEIGKD